MACEIQYQEHIGRELKRLDNLIRSTIDSRKQADDKELTRMQSWIIGYLYRHDQEPVYQKDIEAAFSIARSTATGILQLMEKKEYIRRVSVEHDARLKRLVLTQKGIELEEETIRNVNWMERKLREGIEPGEIEMFMDVLRRMRSNLEEERSENDRRRDHC